MTARSWFTLTNYRSRRILEIGGVFLALLLAVWIAIQSPTAPQLMLSILLYVLVINFSIRVSVGYVGLAPLVAISSVLTMGVTQALLAAAIGIPLAEIMRPVWKPLRRLVISREMSLTERAAVGLVTFGSLGVASLSYLRLLPDNNSLITQILAQIPNTSVNTFEPILLTTFYFIIYLIASLILWRWYKQPRRNFLIQTGGNLFGSTFFAIPLTLFIAQAEIGMPAFVLLCAGIAAFAITSWNSWQRRQLMLQRLDQFASLNMIGSSLRETLDLNTVLLRTYEQIARLIPAEQFHIALIDDNGAWEQPALVDGAIELRPMPHPDSLTAWVSDNAHVLDLDPNNMHHAERRGMTLPDPAPRVWLGVPLQTADQTIGVMILQKFEDPEPFTLWSRELLLSFAGQASAAIQNARLHSETVRLFNLTDEALARRVEQLQALLDAITEGVIMLNRAGEVVLSNPTAAELLETSSSELQGYALTNPLWLEGLGFTTRQWADLLIALRSDKMPSAETTTYSRTVNDRRQWFQRGMVPVVSADEQLMGWLMVFRDVTEERERVEWRADLTRMIVHDLRNPITTLSSTMSLIENRLDPDGRIQFADLLAMAQHGTANMLEMVDSLMDINRAEAGSFVIDAEAMRMTTLMDAVLHYAKPLAIQRQVTIHADYPTDIPIVWGDHEILRRVLINLLDNALKFTPTGGTIAARIERLPATDTHDEGAKVIIIDSGPGVPADMKARIFDRFVTFNRGGGQIRGTGLGLTFCKLAIEAHDGIIWVEDGTQGGSAFCFTVPGIPVF